MAGAVPIEVCRPCYLTLSARVMRPQALKYPHTKVINTTVLISKEIQTALVELEDKEKSIIGSSQWIGAFEVNLCVQNFMRVRSFNDYRVG